MSNPSVLWASSLKTLTGFLAFFIATIGASAEVTLSNYTFRFVNHTTYDPSQIYLFANDVASGPDFSIKYNNGTESLVLQTSVTLQDILYNGNFDLTVQYSKSLALYVGLNAGAINPTIIADGGLPSYTGGPLVPWSQKQYGIVEASVTGVNDNADVSAINSVGVPMHMTNATGNQSVGFNDPSKLATLRNNLQAQMPELAWPDTTDPIRYVGPNQAPVGTLTIPGSTSGLELSPFTTYFDHVHTHNVQTKIESNISVLKNAAENWQFNYDFTMTVDASGNLVLTGSVTYQNTLATEPDDPGYAPVTITGLTATVTADDPDNDKYAASNFVYASQASLGNDDISIGGDWNLLATGTGMDFDTVISPNVIDRVLGDVSFGFAYGFIASDAMGDEPSGNWYAEGQTLVFSDLQPDNEFYSLYSKLIFDASSHVYSHPYSDRMKDALFENSIALSGNDIMVIHIYDFATIPEPSTVIFTAVLGAGLVGLVIRRRLNKKAA